MNIETTETEEDETMTTTTTTSTAYATLVARGYTVRRNQYPGRCDCGRGHAAGSALIARGAGGQNWHTVCRRRSCAEALLRWVAGATGDAEHDGVESTTGQ